MDYAEKNYHVNIHRDDLGHLFQAYVQDPSFGELSKRDPVDFSQVLDTTMAQKNNCGASETEAPTCAKDDRKTDKTEDVKCENMHGKYIMDGRSKTDKPSVCFCENEKTDGKKKTKKTTKKTVFVQELDQTMKDKKSERCVPTGQVTYCAGDTNKGKACPPHTDKSIVYTVADDKKGTMCCTGVLKHAAEKVNKIAHHVANNVQKKVDDKLKDVTKSVSKGAGDLAHKLTGSDKAAKAVEKKVKDMTGAAAEKASEGVKKATEKVAEVTGDLANKGTDVAKKVADSVKDQAADVKQMIGRGLKSLGASKKEKPAEKKGATKEPMSLAKQLQNQLGKLKPVSKKETNTGAAKESNTDNPGANEAAPSSGNSNENTPSADNSNEKTPSAKK